MYTDIPPNKNETTAGVREAPHAVKSKTKSMNSPANGPSGCHKCGGPTSVNMHSGTDAADESSAHRSKYFFEDGNVTFSVDGILYCVHRYLFRHSAHFSTRFAQLGTCDHGVLSTAIPLEDIKRKDFDAFLSVLYPENFGVIGLSYEEWKSVLHLSTMWAFPSLRKWALNFMVPPTPHDQLLLARTYSIDHWVVPALSALCERGMPLNLNEARKMKLEDVILVTNVREDIRSPVLRVAADEIPCHVEAAQAKILADVQVPPAVTSEPVEEDDTPESDDRDFSFRFGKLDKPQPSDTDHVISQGGSSSTSIPDCVQSASIGLGFLPGSMGNGARTGSESGQSSSTSATEMSREERFFDASSGHTSPPPTPSITDRSTSLRANVDIFVPGKKITIKNRSGQVVNLLDLVKRPPPPTTLPSPLSVKKRNIERKPLWIESEKQRQKRLAEEREREEAARREIEEQGRKAEEERKAKEEAERAKKEQKERAEREQLDKEARAKEAEDDVLGADDDQLASVLEQGKTFEDAQTTINTNVLPLLPSPLATARFIEDIYGITYPPGIKGPKVALNVNTPKGKFYYDREFLLQFMNLCKERPDNLPPLDALGMEPRNTASQARTGRNRNRKWRDANESSRAAVVENVDPTAPVSTMGPAVKPVAPLEVSANRWVATSTRHNSSGLDSESPEMVERKVKALLNKLTMMHFESISDQIITWANKSEKEQDGRTLVQVIKLIFDAVTDEATLPEIYARLCRKMREQIGHKVQDDSIKNSEGKPLAGGRLFLKYLANRCQEDFERDWVAEETATAAAATTVSNGQAIKKANENIEGGEGSELYFDDSYAAAKAKRRGMGFIRFIGELFKLQMLTERIVHECIKKLLGNVESPEEEEIESVCKLLTTVGSLLDDMPESQALVNMYFWRMKGLLKSKNVKLRMKFMVQDVIELRERRWVPRNTIAAAATIAQVHQVIAKEKLLAQDTEYDTGTEPNSSMFRGGSRRGSNRDTAESASSTSARQPSKPGDSSQFGNINKAKPISSGRVDLGAEGPSSPAFQRQKFKLLPQSNRVGEVSASAGREATSDDEEAKAKAQIVDDTREFFSVRLLDQAEWYFSRLPEEYRRWLVEALVMKSIEMEESDVRLVKDLFVRVRENDLCSPGAFEEGLNRLAELVEDMATNIPNAWPYFVTLLRATGLDQDEERLGRIAEITQYPDELKRAL